MTDQAYKVEIALGLLNELDKAYREDNRILQHVIKRTIEGMDSSAVETAVDIHLGLKQF